MTLQEFFSWIGVAVAAVGGVGAVVIGVSKGLGDFWVKTILQRQTASLQNDLEQMRHELSLTKASYDYRLGLILDYYALFYRHYRLCQRTTSADAHRQLPDGPVVYTKHAFLGLIDQFILDWAAQEGRIRLLLPASLLPLHEEAVERFNKFKHAVDGFRVEDDKSKERKEKAFEAIEDLKSRIEVGLRTFLRTEKLL